MFRIFLTWALCANFYATLNNVDLLISKVIALALSKSSQHRIPPLYGFYKFHWLRNLQYERLLPSLYNLFLNSRESVLNFICGIGFQEYVIRTQRGPLPERSWRVNRRYNDFAQLNGALSMSGITLPLPPKKIIGNMEPDFVARRQIALQVRYQQLREIPLSYYVSNCSLSGANFNFVIVSSTEFLKRRTNESHIGIFVVREKVSGPWQLHCTSAR